MRKPADSVNIPIGMLPAIVISLITASATVLGAAYAMRDHAVASTLQVVDKKLENYVPIKTWLEKWNEKDQNDRARYYDLKSGINELSTKFDQLRLEVRNGR